MSQKETALVSIVTPTYNGARHLEELLRSVESQDYPRIEHIVIDDGSKDDGVTKAILARHPRVRWWSRENRGQYATLNEGFRAATGEIITTISADDTYADAHAVSIMADYLRAHPECDAVHGHTLHIDENGVPLPVQPHQEYPYWMLRYNLGFILHCSLFLRRDRLLRDGLLFDESLRYTGDGDWEARLYEAGYRFGRVRRFIGAYRHHSLQASITNQREATLHAYQYAERATVDRRYGKSRMLRWLVSVYVTFHRRQLIAAATFRNGGFSALWARFNEWRHRSHRTVP